MSILHRPCDFYLELLITCSRIWTWGKPAMITNYSLIPQTIVPLHSFDVKIVACFKVRTCHDIKQTFRRMFSLGPTFKQYLVAFFIWLFFTIRRDFQSVRPVFPILESPRFLLARRLVGKSIHVSLTLSGGGISRPPVVSNSHHHNTIDRFSHTLPIPSSHFLTYTYVKE